MKYLILILMTIPTLTFAKTIDLFDHANFFRATSVSYEPLCPKDPLVNCITDGTIISLTFAVGCTEIMSSFEYKEFNGPNGEIDIVFAARKEHKMFPMHELVCTGFEIVTKQITLIGIFTDNAPLHNLGDFVFEDLGLEDVNFSYLQ